ncbi:MAG TPA: dihydroneopterin aldolase [Lutibacter sp.]|nr:dihydroneopterin aldolase [Lutibacter sp.]
MGKITINTIKLFSNHGCLEEEGKIGSLYHVKLSAWASFKKAAQTDNLIYAVDYVHLNKIVKEEMAIRSQLLEQVADRILTRVLKEIPMIRKVKVSVSKINPPIGGNVSDVSIIMSKKQKVKKG